MRWVAALLVLALAGCSGGDGTGPDDDVPVVATGALRGVVVDEAIRPLSGVTVLIVSLDNLTWTTDSTGEFYLQELAAGSYIVQAAKVGYLATQTTVQVVADVAAPPVTQLVLPVIPSEKPFVEAQTLTGYLSFGAALGATSLGTTAYGPLAEALGDRSVWTLQFNQLPEWSQGELVWDQTQRAGGEFIWEMTNTSETASGHSETSPSPALAYWDTSVLAQNRNTTLDPAKGIAYRFFGGPHTLAKPGDACPPLPEIGNPCRYGYGVTTQQKADAYVHNFYNFVPPAGWRFTVDGDPDVPPV